MFKKQRQAPYSMDYKIALVCKVDVKSDTHSDGVDYQAFLSWGLQRRFRDGRVESIPAFMGKYYEFSEYDKCKKPEWLGRVPDSTSLRAATPQLLTELAQDEFNFWKQIIEFVSATYYSESFKLEMDF